MGLIREQTRRFWTATIFLAFGPALIALTVFQIIQRSGVESKSLYERAVSKAVGYDVQIDRLEFLSPNLERLVNVEFIDPFTQESFAFSPEIYLCHIRDRKLLKQFETAFERPGELNDASGSVVGETASPVESTRDSLLDYSQEFLIVLIPQTYVKDDNLADFKNTFLFQFGNSFGVKGNQKHDNVVCLVADQVTFQIESQFFTTLESRDSNIQRKSQSTILETFRSASLLRPKTNKESENRFSPSDVVAFSSEPPVIEHFRALYIDSRIHNRRKIDALFELSKIACAVPYYASLESAGHEETRIELSTNGEAIPGSFITRFAPFFHFLDYQGWMEGTVIVAPSLNEEGKLVELDAPKEKVPSSSNQSVFLLKDFHLCQFDLERVTLDLDFEGLSGIVTDLSVDDGLIKNGVIQCVGRIKAKRGTIPSELVHNLRRLGLVKIAPKRVEAFQFVNDALPLDAFELYFELRPNGILLNATNKSNLLAYYDRDNIKYGLYLDSQKTGKIETYANLIAGFTSSESEKSIWTPLVKKAFVHLPVVKTAHKEDERTRHTY